MIHLHMLYEKSDSTDGGGVPTSAVPGRNRNPDGLDLQDGARALEVPPPTGARVTRLHHVDRLNW